MKLASLRPSIGWDPRFCERAPELWPLGRAAAPFVEHADWPAPAELMAAFVATGHAPVVTFELAPPRPRRGPRQPGPGYDTRIVVEGRVPTRARSWHDLLNALVWATFPRAKLALHRRQHRAVARAAGTGARTREGDAVAMVDEGGVLLVGGHAILFGHALHEHLVMGGGKLTARTVELGALPDATAQNDEALVAIADERLALLFEDPGALTSPASLGRLDLR